MLASVMHLHVGLHGSVNVHEHHFELANIAEVELLLALSSHASGSGSSAVKHADGVFIFAPAGVFRSCALLFVRLLDDDVRAERAEDALRACASVRVTSGVKNLGQKSLPLMSPKP